MTKHFQNQRQEWIKNRETPFNRRDLAEAFGISIPQASLDIKEFKNNNPDALEYCNMTKEYSKKSKTHRWDSDGERCLDCGDKDWMADPVCKPPAKPLFKRGDRISFYGKDSVFHGYFIGYIEKLTKNSHPHLDGNEPETPEIRCVVQQAHTGILLIKPNPTEENRGW